MLTYFFGFKITERAIAAAILSFVLFLVFGEKVIKLLRNFGMGQRVSQWGPQRHLMKEGTPTAGGIFIYLFSVISVLLFGDLKNVYLILSLLTFSLFTVLGTVDDMLKKKSKKRGLTIFQKFFVQVVLSTIVIYLTQRFAGLKTDMDFPFLYVTISLPLWLYFVLSVFIVTGSSNAVNLTDGLDGLAAGHLLIAFVIATVFTYLSGHSVFAEYLGIVFVSGVGEVTVLTFAVMGVLLGFLWFNSYPAQIFMGDSGSLSLGALLGYISVIGKFELFLPILEPYLS